MWAAQLPLGLSHGQPNRNATYPSVRLLLAGRGAPVLQQLEEGLLRDILRCRPIPDDLGDGSQDPGVRGAEQPLVLEPIIRPHMPTSNDKAPARVSPTEPPLTDRQAQTHPKG